jgi:adenylate cyclase
VTNSDNLNGSRPVKSISRRAQRLAQELGPRRLGTTALFLLVALLIGRFSWDVPLVIDAERALYDIRHVYSAPTVDQDTRITMVVYNDDTLIDTKKRSPLDRAVLARALQTLDQMGAKGIGIDILFDQPQDEDAALVQTFRAMKTPTHIAYANIATTENTISYRQQAFLDGFIKQLRGSNTHPASIRFEVDSDNVARSWPTIIKGLPPFLARALVPAATRFRSFTGSIAYRLPATVDRPVFASLPIDLFQDPAMAGALRSQIAGRLILIGGDITDIDQFETPLYASSKKPMTGLEVHAHMLAQLLDGREAPRNPPWINWVLALLVVLAGGLSSLFDGWGARGIAFLAGQIAVFGGLPFWMQAHGTDTQFLPACGWIIGWIIAFSAVGSAAQQVGSEQRRFAQSALGKYLPRDIANEILAEPDRLALRGEKREIFVIFSDLEGFTALSHQVAPEMVAQLLNRYLDMLCVVVLDHGGTIDKFVGDAVVAFWGAPISRPDDGERAARAAYAMWQAGETFRNSVPAGVPPVGKTRVGLHFGEAIIGNFGGEGRIQYTALGDSMNTASRLESASKKLDTNVIASREAVERSNLDWWRPMGQVQLRGRKQPVDIFEPAPNLSALDRSIVATAVVAFKTDRSEAIAQLTNIAARDPTDKPIANMLNRFINSEPGGYYVLD